ncbi:MAG: DUF1592 domain-containing protein [Planctomycetaceae bacterium]|nr:DUF1592 domain-containing protein [Planctomycetaceae bacterium]
MPTSPHTLPGRIGLSLILSTYSCLVAVHSESVAADDRVSEGLQVLYEFRGEKGDIVDSSGVGTPINLSIRTADAVERGGGVLRLTGPAVIRSNKAPVRLTTAVRQSGALTFEVWLTPANNTQKGPARIVTLSRDSVRRNVTVGQDGNRFDVRLRTERTSENGLPSLSSPKQSARPTLTHVVYTRAADGQAVISIDGEPTERKKVAGSLRNWDQEFPLALADELSGERPWLGELHLVAIYSKALSAEQVRQNFEAGPAGKLSAELLAQRAREAAAQHFETAVAPILARNCLECHDAASRAGELNLATSAAAIKGGDGGPVIVPGRPEDSSLWLSVDSDAMPDDRPPLKDGEKAILKEWIAAGAVWSLREIDPAVYVHAPSDDHYVQRLTVDEYIQTVQQTLNVDISSQARRLLPPDLRADGFSNTAYNLNVDLKHIDAWSKLAAEIVSRMEVDVFVKRFSNRRKFTDKDMEDVILKTGRWVLRGPVTKQELFAYRGIMTTVAGAGGTHTEAMECVLEAMLQSPRFVYRIEQQRGGGTLRPSEFELASRLSYIIWGGPPDEKLLTAAAEGTLSRQLSAHVDRMLSDDRARQHSQRFLNDWLHLDRLNNLQPNGERYPDWSPELARDMQAETLAYFDEVIWQRSLPLSALMNTRMTLATQRLAQFYRLPQSAAEPSAETHAVAAHTDQRLQKYDLAGIPGRGGLLTQGSLLTVGGDDASMVTRGLLVMHELLRGVVNDPPPCVDTTPVPTRPGRTQRSIAMERISDARCGGCHGRFEPLAFGLEKFDGIGRYRSEDEHGNRLREDGEVLVPGTPAPVSYDTAGELMDLLAESDRVSQSLTWKVTQFAVGRPLAAADAAILDRIHRRATASGGTWTATLRAIVTSELVTGTRDSESL